MLELEGVVKRRSQGDSSFELQVPRFSLEPGRLVAVIGESGCGKSTLLDLLALILAPTHADRFQLNLEGGATCDLAALWAAEREPAIAAVRRATLGYVPQTGGLLPFLSVRDNLLLPARIKGVAVDPQELAQLTDRLGIGGCLDRMPASLSVGQRQRVAILRAILHRPRILLADEPTAAVDKKRGRRIIADMDALTREQGLAVVMVSHDIDLLAGYPDRAYGFVLTQVSDTETRSVCRELTAGTAS